MQQIPQSDSILLSNENQQNQFLLEYMQYESCPFCMRSFFRGKLAYHLKHCSNENPMSKGNKLSPTPRHFKNSLSAATSYERCGNCNSRIPSFLVSKHKQSCSRMSETKIKKLHDPKDKPNPQPPKPSSPNPEQTIFPKIRSSTHDNVKPPKRLILNQLGPKIIKIRQELRCLRIAEQVQKIQCEHCGRKFSEQASLRHIPICSLLKMKEKQEIVYSKEGRAAGKKNKTKLEGFGKSYELISSKVLFSSKNQTNSTALQISETTETKPEQPNPIPNPEVPSFNLEPLQTKVEQIEL